jgi:PAS domain S-box-containing protein
MQGADPLQAVFESSPLAIAHVDADRRVVAWNRAAERMFGWTREELLGRRLPLVPPARQAEHDDLVERVAAGEAHSEHETVRLRKDGTPIDVSLSAAAVRDEDGVLTGHVVIYADITQRKRQEAQLAASEARLRAVFDSTPVAVVEVDLDTKVRRWNRAAEQIFGWTREEIVGQPGDLLVPPDRRSDFDLLIGKVRAGEGYAGFETVRRRKDGRLVDVEISAAPIRDAAGAVVSHIVVFRDVTRRRRQDEELHRLNAELRARVEEVAASRARIVEAGDAARRRLERNLHDGAQQRLVALSLSLKLAQRALDGDPERARAALEAASGDLAAALDELRELARGLHPTALSDHGLAAAVQTLVARAPVPVDVVELPAERLPEPIEAASYYVIAEALTNVAKYARADAAVVRVAAARGAVQVEVSDDGVGGADPRAGSGLCGLADRVEALGGRLDVLSPAGQGTRLRAVIPLPSGS